MIWFVMEVKCENDRGMPGAMWLRDGTSDAMEKVEIRVDKTARTEQDKYWWDKNDGYDVERESCWE